MLDEYFQEKLSDALDLIQNDTESAIIIFDELLEAEPNNIEVLNGKGSALMKLNRMDDAEVYFDESNSIKKNSSAYINKGIISKNKKDYQNALKYYDAAVQLNPSLNSIINILRNEIIELMDENIPNNYTAKANENIKKGMDYKNENKLWDAMDCFNQAISEDHSCKNTVKIYIEEIKQIIYKEFLFNTPDFKDTKMDDLKIKAFKALLVEENPKKAMTLMNLILEMDENDLDTLNCKGSVLFLFDKCHDALICFDKCLDIDDEYYYALFNKAMVLRKMNNLKESLECFKILLKIPKYEKKAKRYRLEILEKIAASN